MPSAQQSGSLRNMIANWSLNTKILSIVAVLSLVGAGVGVFAITQMAQLSQSADDLYNGSVVPMQDLEDLAVDIGGMRAAVLNHAISRTEADMSRYEGVIRTNDATFDADVAEYRPRTADT